jgi:hypothetical protein
MYDLTQQQHQRSSVGCVGLEAVCAVLLSIDTACMLAAGIERALVTSMHSGSWGVQESLALPYLL